MIFSGEIQRRALWLVSSYRLRAEQFSLSFADRDRHLRTVPLPIHFPFFDYSSFPSMIRRDVRMNDLRRILGIRFSIGSKVKLSRGHGAANNYP